MSERECRAWTRHPTVWGRFVDLVRWGHIEHDCELNRPGAFSSHSEPHKCERCGLCWPLSGFENRLVALAKKLGRS